MKFVIGGAYQGKLDFVLQQTGLTTESVFTCSLETLDIDFSYPVIDQIQRLVWAQQQRGLDSLAFFKDHQQELAGKILICEDIFNGVVPIDPATRLWRENTGRCGVYLAREADEVYRVFCGLPTRIKP